MCDVEEQEFVERLLYLEAERARARAERPRTPASPPSARTELPVTAEA